MSQNDIAICSAFLASSEKLPDRFLFVGRTESNDPQKGFLFYLFEVLSPWSASAKVKKAVIEVLERNSGADLSSDSVFENILQSINESLNSLAKKGESHWIGNINGIVGIVQGKKINIAQTGKVFGYIFRKGKISSLTENCHLREEPHPLKTFSDITSGKLAAKDRIVFGNAELYNHISLDRIRRIIEPQCAKESLQELFKNLKKIKVNNVNSIIFEAEDASEPKHLLDLPEFLSLDDTEDNIGKKLAKQYGPLFKKLQETAKKNGGIIHKNLKSQSKKLLEKTDESWKKYNPQAKEFSQKTGEFFNDRFTQVKDSVKPQFSKIANNQKLHKVKIKNFPRPNKNSLFWDKTAQVFSILFNALKTLMQKENRKYLYACLILIFITMGYMKIRANNSSRTEKKQEQEIALSYDKAKEAFDKAKEDIALNRTDGTQELANALELAKKAQESSATKEKSVQLTKEIQESIDKITKTVRLYNPSPIINFGSTSNIILAGSDIYTFDNDGKVYLANIKDKEPRLVASIGKDNADIESMTFSPTENTIFIYTANQKIFSYDIDAKNQSELKIKDEGKWEDAKAITSFTTNLYLLNSEAGEIWKHSSSADKQYSKGSTYTKPTPTLKGSVDITVDGNIYVLKNDGTVLKYSRGANEPGFSLKNIPKPTDQIKEPIKIYTDEDTNYIFILDKKENRVIRFDKAGEFVKQYTIDNLPIDNFVVNGKIQKLWLGSQGKVFELDF